MKRKWQMCRLNTAQSYLCCRLTVTCSKSCPNSWDPATTSLSAIHCSMSSISRFNMYSLSTSSSLPLLSFARSFKLAYNLSTWDCFTWTASLKLRKQSFIKVFLHRLIVGECTLLVKFLLLGFCFGFCLCRNCFLMRLDEMLEEMSAIHGMFPIVKHSVCLSLPVMTSGATYSHDFRYHLRLWIPVPLSVMTRLWLVLLPIPFLVMTSDSIMLLLTVAS